MRFNSQYPLLLACVKAVCFVWAERRDLDPSAAPPGSLFFLQAVSFCCMTESIQIEGFERRAAGKKNRSDCCSRGISGGCLCSCFRLSFHVAIGATWKVDVHDGPRHVRLTLCDFFSSLFPSCHRYIHDCLNEFVLRYSCDNFALVAVA
jgi:hypothetical protein